MSNTRSNRPLGPYATASPLPFKKKEVFKNINAINANISHLYKTIGAPLVPEFKNDLVIASSCYQGDIVSRSRQIARQIADFYGLNTIRVDVAFVKNLTAPGRVQLSSGDRFMIEIDEKYVANTNFTSAILAHEIAHIYLFRHKVTLDDTLQNEILTDTAAAFLGCAWLLLNSSYKETSYLGDQIKVNCFGYITQYEVGYILAKRDFLLQHDSSEQMMYGRSEEFFEAGRAYFLQSLKRPYVQRSRLENAVYHLKSHFTTGSLVFRCICCEQQLRIPESNKTLSVHCPSCHNNLLCYS